MRDIFSVFGKLFLMIILNLIIMAIPISIGYLFPNWEPIMILAGSFLGVFLIFIDVIMASEVLADHFDI